MSESPTLIRCIIVDDEPLAQKVIEQHVARYPALQLLALCDSATAAFEVLHTHEVDLIFLDINMPVISGLNFLKSLSKPPMVIFTTAYAEYAVEGFELDAVDYLMKPISASRFDRAIEKVLSRKDYQAVAQIQQVSAEPEKDYIFVKTDGKLVKVMYDDILYCEGMKDYLKIHLKSKRYLVIHQTMKGMEDLLPAKRFMRVHKSYIVSLEAIRSFHDNMLHFAETEESIPVSSSYKEDLLKKL